VGAALLSALRQHGFVYLCGHRVDEKLIQTFTLASRRFFELSLAEKMAWAKRDPLDEGYVASGVETLDKHKMERGPQVNT